MSGMIDETHDPKRRSWIASAQGHPEFPIQNLPFGIFTPPGAITARGGVAIGDSILDLKAALDAGLFAGEAEKAARAAIGTTLNPMMGLGKGPRIALRKRLSELLAEDSVDAKKAQSVPDLLHAAAQCTVHLPAAVGDYTDFYAGIHHAASGGRRLRPNLPPLNPNYKYIPIAYHGRASSVRAPSLLGGAVRRPHGQYLRGGKEPPVFGVCEKLDFELEFGTWVGPGNALGERIPMANAADHIFGYCLLNDWSARDIQRWETVPLGPFLGKSFSTTVSPWIITPEALAPFRIAQAPRPEGDPKPLPYLWDDADQAHGALNIELEALMLTEGLRARKLPPHRLTLSNTSHLYWTTAQMLAHHACGGCNLQPGDLFGSGTISGPTPDSQGSLGEISESATKPFTLASGEQRTYLEDGDEIVLRAHARREGFVSIGFGESRGQIQPAR